MTIPNNQTDAIAEFRRSVGFQFGLVMHSGLEIDQAIEHICASALKLLKSERERCAVLAENVFDDNYHAFYINAALRIAAKIREIE